MVEKREKKNENTLKRDDAGLKLNRVKKRLNKKKNRKS